MFTTMRVTRNLSMVMVGVWFLCYALFALIPALSFAGQGTLMALLALVTAILCLVER